MHKTIGLIGGMSPESTAAYYLHITRTYTARFGDYGYPPILIYSVSFQSYVDWPNQNRWDLVAEGLSTAARRLQDAGADVILIATNTMHYVFEQVQASVSVPMISLLDAVADAITARGLHTVGLLGTRFTMEKPFYAAALQQHGISVLVPDDAERTTIHDAIYNELVAGIIRDETRAAFMQTINGLGTRGAQGIILGCTEIPLLVRASDVLLPLFDTTTIHAEAALDAALS